VLRFRGTVAFRDGREEPFETGTAALRHYESYAVRHGLPVSGDGIPPITWGMLIAHAAIGNGAGFDTWAETVDGVDVEAVGVPPTPEEPTAE
jgi:hypothetical protein